MGIAVLLVALLGAFALGGISSGADEPDAEPDLEDDTVDVDPGDDGLTGNVRGTGGNDLLSGIDLLGAHRLDGLAGDDTLLADDGDVLNGGPGSDVFSVVVGTADDAVFVEDLRLNPDDTTGEQDHILFVDRDGTPIPFRGALEAGITAVDAADGSGAEVWFDGALVLKVGNVAAADLNAQSIWIGNFNLQLAARDGDDFLAGDLYTIPNDILGGGAGNDTLIGGDGSDVLDGGAGDDSIDATEPGGATANFDLVRGGLGADTLRGDDGDFLYGVFEDEDGDLHVDTSGTDVFEVVLSDDENADPVIVSGMHYEEGLNLGEHLFFFHADGTPVTQAELDANLVSEEILNNRAHRLSYEGRVVAYVIDATWLIDRFGVGCVSDAAIAADLADELGLSEGVEVVPVAVTEATGNGNVVPDSLFGGNVHFKVNTDAGAPLASFVATAEELDMEHLRFPAGRGDGLLLEDDGVDWLNVVTLVETPSGALDLRPELKSFLDWAQDPDGDGDDSDAKKVTLVLPTKAYDIDAYRDFAPEISRFAEILMRDYGDIIEALEIGNEYWRMGETVYATKANIAIDALLDGFEAAGLSETDQPDILVQMATPNPGSEFHVSVDDRDYVERVRDANQRIIDTLNDQSKEAIDGVIEHYYFNEEDDVFARNNGDVNFINVDYQIWDKAFDKDLSLYITEWNLAGENLTQNGLKYTGVFAEQVSNMLDLGVDVGHIWAVQHNTATDLAGGREDMPNTDDVDRLTNTVRGTTFDIAQQILPGAEQLDLVFTDTEGLVEIYGYEHDDRIVFWVSSRTDDEIDVALDFSEVVPEFETVQGMLITMDTSPSSSDGVHFVTGVGQTEADFSIVHGQRFYFGEHDVMAQIEDCNCQSNVVQRNLHPFESLVLIFYLDPETAPAPVGNPGEGQDLVGTNENDVIEGGPGDDTITGRKGIDAINGRDGNDLIFGGDGNDDLIGWLGDDVLNGGEGRDTLSGREGEDTLRGQDGRDELYGDDGNDRLDGGDHPDTLVGGAGIDTVTGGAGEDVFAFQETEISAGDVITDFEPGIDVIEIDVAGVRSIDDLEFRQDPSAGGVVIDIGGAGVILVEGNFLISDLRDPTNFVFA